MNDPLLWFAGTPAFAADILAQLLKHSDYRIDAVLTRPDRPAGRGRKPRESAVGTVARKADLALDKPEQLDQRVSPFAKRPRPDLCIVVAYGLLLPEWFLAYPRLGCINIHASLLPRWRGAAPITRAIAAGDDQTGVSIMQMDQGLDTGPVWLEQRVAITNRDNTATLSEKLAILGGKALLDALPNILCGNGKPTPQQEHGIVYARKISKAEARIDWTQAAAVIARNIRAYNPAPLAYSPLAGENIRIYAADVQEHPASPVPGHILRHDKSGLLVGTGEDALLITQLQLPGKKASAAAALANGRNLEGYKFS